MININISGLFTTITSSISNYFMFVGLVALLYILAVAFIRVIFIEIYKIIFAIRTPMNLPVDNKNI